jgi:hypothetical protein
MTSDNIRLSRDRTILYSRSHLNCTVPAKDMPLIRTLYVQWQMDASSAKVNVAISSR